MAAAISPIIFHGTWPDDKNHGSPHFSAIFQGNSQQKIRFQGHKTGRGIGL
jgi:hypothetical protein